MAALIHPDGRVDMLDPANPVEGFTLEELYPMLDTDIIEVVHVPGGTHIMIIDEIGKHKDKEHNPTATAALGWRFIASGDYIVGKALICRRDELK